MVVNTATGPGTPCCSLGSVSRPSSRVVRWAQAPGRPVAEALAGAHQGEIGRVEVEAVIIAEGESEAVRERNRG